MPPDDLLRDAFRSAAFTLTPGADGRATLEALLDDFDDTPMFPNASYLISAAELNFWLARDAISRLPEDRQNFAATR